MTGHATPSTEQGTGGAAVADPKSGEGAAEGQPPAAEQKPPESQPAGEQKPPEGKQEPEQKPPPEPVVAKREDLKLPEGSLLKDSDLDKIHADAHKRGLSPELAQAEVLRQSEAIKAFRDRQEEEMEEKSNAWIEQTKADPEIGGDNFQAKAELAKRVVARFGNDAFKDALEKTKLGNYAEFVRFVSRIGEAMTEDQLVLSTEGGAKKVSLEERFYGGGDKK